MKGDPQQVLWTAIGLEECGVRFSRDGSPPKRAKLWVRQDARPGDVVFLYRSHPDRAFAAAGIIAQHAGSGGQSQSHHYFAYVEPIVRLKTQLRHAALRQRFPHWRYLNAFGGPTRIPEPQAALFRAHIPRDMAGMARVDQLDDIVLEAREGTPSFERHKRFERSASLRNEKIRRARASRRGLACEACGFDFERTYGLIGRDFAEVHHEVPLSAAAGSRTTRVSDLAIVCANCHRMLHRQYPALTTKRLRAQIRR